MQDWYRDGIPIWWDESDRVTFDAKGYISKSRAAIQRAEESAGKNKKPTPGRYFIAEPRVMDGGDLPTREEWLVERAKRAGSKANKFGEGNNTSNIVQGRK